MRTAKIYLITNLVNGKKYVGFTVNSLRLRFRQHIRDAHMNKFNMPIHKAILKYGKENFSIDLLYESENIQDTLSLKEAEFIIEHNSLSPNGYNLSSGGDGSPGLPCSEEKKAKISMTEINNQLLGLNPAFLGRKHTKETKAKISKSIRSIRPRTARKWLPQKHSVLAEFMKLNKVKPGQKAIEANIQRLSKRWLITYPNGMKEEIINLKAFCHKHCLDNKIMWAVSQGKHHTHKGYRCQKLS